MSNIAPPNRRAGFVSASTTIIESDAAAQRSAEWNRQRMVRLAKEAREREAKRESERKIEAIVEDVGLAAFLADVEVQPPGTWGPGEKAEYMRIGRTYQERKNKEAADKAKHLEAWAEIERIQSNWRDLWEGSPPEPSPDMVCDASGIPTFPVADLRDFAATVRGTIRSDEADELNKARQSHEYHGGTWPSVFREGANRGNQFISVPRHWVLAIDRDPRGCVPPGLSGAALTRWVTEEWRDNIPGLCGCELCVYAVPGQSVAFVTWWDEPMDRSAARAWCRRITPPHGSDDEPRFMVLPEEQRRAWYVPCEGLYLPSAHAAPAPLPTAVSLARTAVPTRLVTGIAALDCLFRGTGIPMGARVLVAGNPKNGKTLCALEIAEAALAAGWVVVWLAYDERDEQVAIRRLQRRGLSDADAQALPEAALAALDAEGSFHLHSDATLEAAWEGASASAKGAPLLMIADSLQTVRCAAAEGKGERDGLEALIAAVGACQGKWPAAFLATSEVTADGTPKGSGRIRYNFTTLLSVKRSGERLTLTAKDGRDHRDGTLQLVADFDRQRLLDPLAAAKAKATGELQARILEIVAARGGTASQTKIEEDAEGFDNKRVRAEVRAMLDAGTLTKSAKGYSRGP